MWKGSGSLTENDLFAPARFELGSHLRGNAGVPDVPDLYRSFFIQIGVVTPGEPITGQCTTSGETSFYSSQWGGVIAGGYNNIPDLGQVTIDASGNRINDFWRIEDLEVDLDLTSGMIP